MEKRKRKAFRKGQGGGGDLGKGNGERSKSLMKRKKEGRKALLASYRNWPQSREKGGTRCPGREGRCWIGRAGEAPTCRAGGKRGGACRAGPTPPETPVDGLKGKIPAAGKRKGEGGVQHDPLVARPTAGEGNKPVKSLLKKRKRGAPGGL